MKKVRIPISTTFPKAHKRAGQFTAFPDKIVFRQTKIHTIRENVDYWTKKIALIKKGEAKLCMYYWKGMPYRSKTFEFFSTCRPEIDIQYIAFDKEMKYAFVDDSPEISVHYLNRYPIEVIAENDGLTVEDFREWFKGTDPEKVKAIIHFTEFRY
jgi:hypothetical protein